jgi:hypothetical protein
MTVPTIIFAVLGLLVAAANFFLGDVVKELGKRAKVFGWLFTAAFFIAAGVFAVKSSTEVIKTNPAGLPAQHQIDVGKTPALPKTLAPKPEPGPLHEKSPPAPRHPKVSAADLQSASKETSASPKTQDDSDLHALAAALADTQGTVTVQWNAACDSCEHVADNLVSVFKNAHWTTYKSNESGPFGSLYGLTSERFVIGCPRLIYDMDQKTLIKVFSKADLEFRIATDPLSAGSSYHCSIFVAR